MQYVLIGVGIGIGFALSTMVIEAAADILTDGVRYSQFKRRNRKGKKRTTTIPKTKHTLYTYDLTK